MSYKAGGDVRIVMLTSCQSGCDFCHLEGHKSPDEIGVLNPALSGWKTKKGGSLESKLDGLFDADDVQMSMRIAKNMGLNKMHLTGGEPTLHPHLIEVITCFTDNGFEVGITTHGEYSQEKITSLFEAGVSGINFSLHAMNANQYLAMDLVAQNVERKHSKESALKYAEQRVAQKLANIQLAVKYAQQDRRLRIKANTVVRDSETALNIIKWCNNAGVDVRLQRDLNNKQESDIQIQKVIQSLGAKPTRNDLAIGDSSGAGTQYRYKDGLFKVKTFGEVYISSMCNQCPLFGTQKCKERFYGLRIEHGSVSTCIDLQNEHTQFTHQVFLDHLSKNEGIPGEIREQYSAMRRFAEK